MGRGGPQDVAGCVRLAVELLGLDAARHRAKLETLVGGDGPGAAGALFVARAGDALAGYARVEHWERPAGCPERTAPTGWYLMGVLVDPAHRRGGVGRALTEARLGWLRGRTDRVWYFANARNAASLALHAELGFREVTRDFEFPGTSFEGGAGVLSVLELRDT